MKTVTDALSMTVELEEIASGLNLVFLMLKDRDQNIPQYDQPSLSQLAEVIHGHELHLLRVSEDYLTHEDRLTEVSDRKGAEL